MRHITKQFLKHTQRGAITLGTAMIMLLVATYIALYSANFGMSEQTILANNNQAQRTFETADAGMDFAVPYLNKNRTAIIVDTNADGFIEAYSNTNTTNVALTSGGTFSITYTNPVANNFQLIQITSTGVGTDGVATRTIKQDVKFRPIVYRRYDIPVMAKGTIFMSNSAYVSNPIANSTTIRIGSGIAGFWNSAHTKVNGVVSSAAEPWPGVIKSDFKYSDSSFGSATENAFFLNYFGATKSFISSQADYSYTTMPYTALLDGKTGFIWIDTGNSTSTLSFSSWSWPYAYMGTTTNPVVLYVNGNIDLSGYVSITGFVYATGNITFSGNATVTGTIVAGGNINIYNNNNVTYSTTVMDNVQNKIGFFSEAPGSWNDLQ